MSKQGSKDGKGREAVEFDPCEASGKEIPMNQTMRNITTAKITLTFAGLLLAFLLPATTHAQSEIAPDEFKSENMVPITPAPPAKVDFEGKFSLPYQVQCSGSKLTPGEYTLAVKTAGTSKIVTIHREGSDIVLTARIAANPSDSGQSVVLVRHGPGPRARTLEGVYLEKIKMMLYLDESGATNALDKMFASVQRVPIS
jgi:hypothetical protein